MADDMERGLISGLAGNGAVPVSVSARTGQVRTVEDRVELIRTTEGSGSRGSCHSGYSAWGD